MILDSLTIVADVFAERTGWESAPEGLCKGDACVPAGNAVLDDGSLSVHVLADRLRMPLIFDDAHGIHVLGPESGGRALTTAAVPDIELMDVDGNPFQLNSLHGKKVLLVAWASW
jgi:hypothetical protein